MEIKKYTTYHEIEVLDLYASVGWTAYTEAPDTLRQGFASSLLIMAAYEVDTLVGIVRVVGDGRTIVFVQDLLVRPAYQRRGIGSALLKSVLEQFNHVRQIELVTDDTPETLAFYRSMGFAPMREIGCCGMIRL